ncbi:molybdopterin molybdotransferase MoeA [Microcoleus sp. LEGE 07076]|uniref:molybdopterin molybdotransferase MoeA n=1 Tax=Microcoleus sp. LEGE 07076 TaxID=915322 RepID=UPI0018821CEC|nr:gephyrin-like molybdotransferase Glp [Microcoleus sp. LEGE 07076]MBE9185688.1 molybdopterin molybdotransferase MoeA [Microcoleus sp. LEGE 07076]
MLSVKEAESIILSLAQSPDSQGDVETVDLLAASGRILAAPVTSSLDFPYWDNSAMDGYAVRFADVENCSTEKPAVVEVVEEIPAGSRPQNTVQPGQAARIFTGAMMPDGADTVVMQEETRREGDRIFVLVSPEKPQTFVRQKGAFYQAGTTLLTPGTVINAPEMALLATAQCLKVPVYRRLRVAIFSTGDELISPDQPFSPGKLVDSNQYALTVLLAQMGCEPIRLGIIPDNEDALQKAIAQAVSTADVVLSTGGVSVGDYDFVEKVLADLGGKIHIQAVAIKPGKPLTVAQFKRGDKKSDPPPISSADCLYFGLPGNPVSALVCCWRFVVPALRKMSGLGADAWGPDFVKARCNVELQSPGKRETYVWGKLYLVMGVWEFEPASGSQNSANLINLANTTGLAVLPAAETWITPGEFVEVLKVSH